MAPVPHNPDTGQLWNAGPVAIKAKSHKRNALSFVAPKQCAFVDTNGVRCRRSAPYERAAHWLSQGKELTCERPGCGKRFTRGGGGVVPNIDHDHNCCHGRTSCGKCIRGVLCSWCNHAMGQLETLLKSATIEQLVQFLENPCK